MGGVPFELGEAGVRQAGCRGGVLSGATTTEEDECGDEQCDENEWDGGGYGDRGAMVRLRGGWVCGARCVADGGSHGGGSAGWRTRYRAGGRWPSRGGGWVSARCCGYDGEIDQTLPQDGNGRGPDL